MCNIVIPPRLKYSILKEDIHARITTSPHTAHLEPYAGSSMHYVNSVSTTPLVIDDTYTQDVLHIPTEVPYYHPLVYTNELRAVVVTNTAFVTLFDNDEQTALIGEVQWRIYLGLPIEYRWYECTRMTRDHLAYDRSLTSRQDRLDLAMALNGIYVRLQQTGEYIRGGEYNRPLLLYRKDMLLRE